MTTRRNELNYRLIVSDSSDKFTALQLADYTMIIRKLQYNFLHPTYHITEPYYNHAAQCGSKKR